jgi:Flp pilus assembly protein CpaB
MIPHINVIMKHRSSKVRSLIAEVTLENETSKATYVLAEVNAWPLASRLGTSLSLLLRSYTASTTPSKSSCRSCSSSAPGAKETNISAQEKKKFRACEIAVHLPIGNPIVLMIDQQNPKQKSSS